MRIAIEWVVDSNNRTTIKQKIEYVSTMKRDKDEREDCEMNVDYSMKKKEIKKWVVMNISNKNEF